jgi:hypothetical protein
MGADLRFGEVLPAKGYERRTGSLRKMVENVAVRGHHLKLRHRADAGKRMERQALGRPPVRVAVPVTNGVGLVRRSRVALLPRTIDGGTSSAL